MMTSANAMSILKGEAGCLFDATKCGVKPAERPATDDRADQISQGWRDARRDARWTLARLWLGHVAVVIAKLKVLAPYAAIELILPGGSVMALLLWLYRRRKNGGNFGPLPMKLLAFLRLANPSRFNAAARSA